MVLSPASPNILECKDKWALGNTPTNKASGGNRIPLELFPWLDHRKSHRIPEEHLLCFTNYTKVFNCVDHNKLWKILKEMGTPDHLTCLLRKLYAGQKATVRTGHGTMDWLKIGKGLRQGYILSPYLFNYYVEYIMQNAGLDEGQVGIKIARRNINNLRHADDIILMAESIKELKSLLTKVKEES